MRWQQERKKCIKEFYKDKLLADVNIKAEIFPSTFPLKYIFTPEYY